VRVAVGTDVAAGTAVAGLVVGRFVTGGNNGSNNEDGTCVWPATGARVIGATDAGVADAGAVDIGPEVTGLAVETIGARVARESAGCNVGEGVVCTGRGVA
jgi:hypothetical protein